MVYGGRSRLLFGAVPRTPCRSQNVREKTDPFMQRCGEPGFRPPPQRGLAVRGRGLSSSCAPRRHRFCSCVACDAGPPMTQLRLNCCLSFVFEAWFPWCQ